MESRQIPLPRSFSQFVEIEPDKYCSIEKVTVLEWRAVLALLRKQHSPVARRIREASRLLKAAAMLGLPDDVALLPELQARAARNVTSLPPQR